MPYYDAGSATSSRFLPGFVLGGRPRRRHRWEQRRPGGSLGGGTSPAAATSAAVATSAWRNGGGGGGDSGGGEDFLDANARARAALAFGFARIASAARSRQTSARVDNPWFPLKPGTVLTYQGVKDGAFPQVMTVTHRTKRIDGAPVVVVSDSLHPRPAAEHLMVLRTNAATSGTSGRTPRARRANGRITAPRVVAGRARRRRAGIFMPAPTSRPIVPAGVLQGSGRGSLQGAHPARPVQVPYTSSRAVLPTREDALEPGVIDHKSRPRRRHRSRQTVKATSATLVSSADADLKGRGSRQCERGIGHADRAPPDVTVTRR
jgi:hypothetical protein